jgi:hypothetical protein
VLEAAGEGRAYLRPVERFTPARKADTVVEGQYVLEICERVWPYIRLRQTHSVLTCRAVV